METEDGSLFIKNLAYFVRTHEKALANALQLQRQTPKNVSQPATPSATGASTSDKTSLSFASTTLAAALSFPYLNFTSSNVKPAKLTLTPHHLYYLLTRFEELGTPVGPMSIRLENIHSGGSPTSYVSFLAQTQGKGSKSSDRDSIHSVSSMRSVFSMSSLWSSFGLSTGSAAKTERQKAAIMEDLKYLYSAFTKIPCVRFAPDRNAPLIKGFEEFPFDTAVPIFVFKNLSALELCDVDFRQFFGWDRLAEQLRSLTVKRAGLNAIEELVIYIVLDDMDKRRRRSAKAPQSPTLAWVEPYPLSSPTARNERMLRTLSESHSPQKPTSVVVGRSFEDAPLLRANSTGSPVGPPQLPGSPSPSRPPNSRHGSSSGYGRVKSSKPRRSSGSSESSARSSTPCNSSSNLLQLGSLPASKWRFLKHLALPENGLTAVTSTSLAPLANTLQSLDLSSNLLAEIPDSLALMTSLRALNLSNCMIESLHSLARSPLPAITTLNLRGNRLVSLAGIERLLSLERLDLRENHLRDPTELARLTCLPEIHDIYVHRNPFVATHPNFRTTIFNLFRSTPGYTEDVILDSAGPSNSERKQLIDRVPEAVSVPIVKPVAAEEPLGPLKGPGVVRQRADRDAKPDARTQDLPQLASIANPSSSQRRRKGPRRRIVELSNDGGRSPYSANSLTPYPPQLHVLSGPAADDKGAEKLGTASISVERRSHEQEQQADDSDAATAGQISGAGESNEATKEAATFDASGELYKKRIEALRSGIGNGWLSALSDGSVDGRKSGHIDAIPEKNGDDSARERTTLTKARETSHGITAGRRTLG